MFEIRFTPSAVAEFETLKNNPTKSGLLKQLRKQFGFLQLNPRHPSLQTHEFHSIPHPYSVGEKVFEASSIVSTWDGTYKGKLMNTSVFVYYMKVTFNNGKETIRKGNISLIR